MGSHSAHLAFLMPGETCNLIALPGLLEHLAAKAGEWGALNLIGEVDEHTLVFEAFRRSGFSIYAWQRIWQFDKSSEGNPALEWKADKSDSDWGLPSGPDTLAVRLLYQSLVPAFVLPIEPVIDSQLHGLVYRCRGEVIGFAEIISGPLGTWIQPFFHPATENVLEALSSLIGKVAKRSARPIYLCVRSYQAWLESALEDIHAQTGPRQAVMVKHMAVTQKTPATIRQTVLENSRVEPSVQIVHAESLFEMDNKNRR